MKPSKPSFWQVITKTLKRFLVNYGALINYASALVLLVYLFLLLSLSIWPFFARDLTTTVTTATESLSFSLTGIESSWVLPPGDFLGQFPEDAKLRELPTKCDKNSGEITIKYFAHLYLCTYLESTRLVVTGPANVSLEVTPDGLLSMKIVATEESDFLLELRNSEDQLLTTVTYPEEFRFSTTLRQPDVAGTEPESIRIAIIAASGVIGSQVHYASRINNSPGDFWQPMLLAGDVTTFGLNHPSQGKYQILSERLDTGDIIQIDTQKNIFGNAPDAMIWGLASIEKRVVLMSGATEVNQFAIHAVLQTTHRVLGVTRFGSPTGHEIRASFWAIISKWPNGQQYWVFVISVVLILTFGLQLRETIRDKKKKKRKKHKKEDAIS